MPSNYEIVVRANPKDFADEQSVKDAINPYLEALGRIPEVLIGSLRTLTVNGPGKFGFGAAGGDITMNVNVNGPSAGAGNIFVHEGVHLALDPFLTEEFHEGPLAADCNQFYSEYSETASAERLAESFLVYYGLRFRRERISGELQQQILAIGPN